MTTPPTWHGSLSTYAAAVLEHAKERLGGEWMVCERCGLEKPLRHFHRHREGRYGVCAACREKGVG